MTSDHVVTATFTATPPPPPPPPAQRTLTVSKAGTGSGTVTSSPAGIDCGTACSHAFTDGTAVTLTASAPAGSTFTGWSGGGCSGTGNCTVTLNGADRDVTATFDAQPLPSPGRVPNTRITGATISSRKHRASFRFKATGVATGFRCELKRAGHAARLRHCSSPKAYKRLERGKYVFEVRAVGPGGADPTPARKRFRIASRG
jgi:hypothetical protein